MTDWQEELTEIDRRARIVVAWATLAGVAVGCIVGVVGTLTIQACL